MSRFGLMFFALAAALVGVACNEEAADVVTHETQKVVEKSIFEGDWWYARTTIDVDSDEAYVFSSTAGFAPWQGDMSYYDGSLGQGTIARIRWVIDQDYLFAYRAYEIIRGGNADANEPSFRGQPLAVFKINEHFNVQRTYNTVTGEVTNVVGRNGADQRWYDAKFMEIDWSQNLVTDFYFDITSEYALFNIFHQEQVPLYVQEGADFPQEWKPVFRTVAEEHACSASDMGDSSCYRFFDEWAGEDQDTVHFMSFVTNEVWTPSDCYSGGCNPINVTRRHAFLRVPPAHEYALETTTNQEFDRFGTMRSEQSTYVRGGENTEVRRTFCRADSDCGEGGSCDTAAHYCVGGLTEDYGETDFLSFSRLRHNFYSKSFTETECIADWECDGRYAEVPGTAGSVCDRAARRCTIPLTDRPLRQVAYHLSPGYPAFLVRSAFGVIGEWNEVFMKGARAARGEAPPTGPSVSCQSDDPTRYCFCGSAEAIGGTCEYKYDPFVKPSDSGAENAYDCYVEGPADQDDPQSFSAYDPASAYNYKFVGSECLFILNANSCDKDPTKECEQLGDIRYQFFNYVHHGSVGFCGVMEPLQDPLNGEAVVSPANMSGECLESIGNLTSQFFPVLRGEIPEDQYFQGEHVRGYFENLGRVEHPATQARANTSDGVGGNDGERPGLPVDFGAKFEELIASKPELQQLHGPEGRAMIMSDRLRNLAGTPIEARLVQSLGVDGQEAISNLVRQDRLAGDPTMGLEDVLDEVSPFRENYMTNLTAEQRRIQILSKRGFDPMPAALYTSRYWAYWAKAFEGHTIPESDIRMRQAYHRSVMLHEVGHAIGLEHNFAASLDRNNYYDGYYKVALEHPLPNFEDYDEVEFGGNNDNKVSGEELNRYYEDLRQARNDRAEAGAGNVMASSIMEYPGDLSDMSGLGKYDNAAVMFNYFNLYETYVTEDPAVRTCTQDSDCGVGGSCVDSDSGGSAPKICRIGASALENLHWSDQVDRTYWRYYRGGESCSEDTDCPFADQSGALVSGQAISQRCVHNTRVYNERRPQPCEEGDAHCVCSGFDSDFSDYLAGNAYRTDADPSVYYPTDYMFCTNGRENDISWCSMFDAGESFREVIDHYRRGYEEGYPNGYFRRYRRNFGPTAASIGSLINASKIYQHLFYRYYYDPGFRSDDGPTGFEDQALASIDAMNWIIELSQMPDVGTYELNDDGTLYEQVSEDPEAASGDGQIGLVPGQAFYTWSKREEGIQGFYRYARSGVFMDKFNAMLALALRDWGLSYTIDERFYINFYELFEVEMTEFFGGMILDNPRWFAPRVKMGEDGQPVVQHMNFYRNLFFGECRDRTTGNTIPCRNESDTAYPDPAIANTSNDVLRDWATILTLATFPVFYDTSFEQRLSIWKIGNGDGFTFPEHRPDGSPVCEYEAEGCEDPWYVVFESDRLHTSYIAIKLESRAAYNLPEEQLSYELLRQLKDLQTRVRALKALETPTADESAELTRLSLELQRGESFLDYLIDIQRAFGISSYL